MAKHNKIIGIIGGMGPEAGCILHSYINQAARRILKTKRDADYPNILHLSMPKDITDRADFLLGLTTENPAKGVVSLVEELSKIGRNIGTSIIACVACNAFHTKPIWDYFSNQIEHFNNLSLLHLVDATVENIQKTMPPPARIAVFSTIGLNKEKLYECKLEPLGYEMLQLTPQQEQDIHRAIYDYEFGIKANSAYTEKAFNLLSTVVQSLKEQEVNKIILGCTELSIVFPAGCDQIFIDPMMIAAEKLVLASME